MTCNFRVGQKVVCIYDGWQSFFHPGEGKPEKGIVYTIRDVYVRDRDGSAFLRFEEIRNPLIYRNGEAECSYAAHRFRPVVQRKTDISIFKALLTPSKEKVETAS